MKLIIQIPCYNEEDSLPETLKELPLKIDGIDQIEILIIDDGSTDQTSNIAKECNVNHIIRHKINQGLAQAFRSGIEFCVNQSADIIVNTDADNQYPGAMIPNLIEPIVEKKADIVIGDRQIGKIGHFSRTKKVLQRLGSWTIRKVSGTDIPDAPCGFRAFSKEAALKMNVLTDYTYTLETIIQAGRNNIIMTSIPIYINPPTRSSRLMKSTLSYIGKSTKTILMLFVYYEPLRFFIYLSTPFFIFGGTLWLRYLYLIFTLQDVVSGAFIQSVVVGGISLLFGIFLFCLGLIGDILKKNRLLNEEQLYLIKKNIK